MIWLLFAPVLALLYVVWLCLKAIFVLFVALLHVLFPSKDEPTIGEIDFSSGKVRW